jgi:hypothetical protein
MEKSTLKEKWMREREQCLWTLPLTSFVEGLFETRLVNVSVFRDLYPSVFIPCGQMMAVDCRDQKVE